MAFGIVAFWPKNSTVVGSKYAEERTEAVDLGHLNSRAKHSLNRGHPRQRHKGPTLGGPVPDCNGARRSLFKTPLKAFKG